MNNNNRKPTKYCMGGDTLYLLDGKNHRIDGPAVIRSDGIVRWYYHGKWVGDNKEGFWGLWDHLTDDERNNTDLLYHLPGAR